ncbi:hypothetical protein BDZ91DRAFT_791544 [Kalaharituber pfeilii]|nr:hypothetical protein BDZ91DRAFT_791544 [Kalaharituber pfeilii]
MPGLQASTTTGPSTSAASSIDIWDYAVPLENELGHYYHQGSTPSSLKSRKGTYDSLTASGRTNGYGSRSVSNPLDPTTYLDPPKPHSLHRNNSNISSNHDGDSVFDLYGGRLSTVGAMSTDSISGQNGNLTDEESKWIDSEKLARIEGKQLEQLEQLKNSEYSRWIDRDKLEQIEIQELEQAGIKLPLKAIQNHYQHDGGILKRQRTNSDSSEDESKFYNPNEPSNDLRHPAEQLADAQRHPMQYKHRNGSFSRIPLYTSSPLPVRQQFIERSAPLIRQPPSPEQGSDDDSITYAHSRKRSHSTGSNVMLAENTPAAGPKPPPTPKANRVQTQISGPGRSNSKSKSRFSANSTLAKHRSKSNPQLSPNHRPGTGTSSHQAPEGPPPWSLSTYSPDPKLPPERQLIPTVAKRLQQEQWEKEGVFATVYDGKLRPLKVENIQDLEKEKQEKEAEEKEENQEQNSDAKDEVMTNEAEEWPLRSPLPLSPISAATSPQKPEEKNEIVKPALIKNETQFLPRTITKVNGHTVSQAGQTQAIRMETSDEYEKKPKRKLLCCVVM